MTIWITSNFLQQALSYKDINFSIQNTKLLSYLSSGDVCSIKLSHSDYLNLPVTLDNELWATKKKVKARVIFLILANKIWNYVLNSASPSGGSFLCINIKPFWLPMALDHQQQALRSSTEKGEVLKLRLVKGPQCHCNRSQQLFVTWKQAFSEELSHNIWA